MKSIIKIGLTTLILAIFCNKGFSQFSVSYFHSSFPPKIGLGYNFSGKVWSEFRLYNETDIYSTYMIPELVVCYNFVNKNRHNIYAGIGALAAYDKGIVVPIGVQFTPFEKFDRFSLHIEMQPTFIIDNYPIILSGWGFRYKFGGKNSAKG